MKRILFYMGLALISLGILSPLIDQPAQVPVVQAVEKRAEPVSQPTQTVAKEETPAQITVETPPAYEQPPIPQPDQSGTCDEWIAAAGVTEPEQARLLIQRESGCNPNAVNASSGACGIGQQLPCGKWSHTRNEPVGAIQDMQGYVMNRYGSWANANAAWESRSPHWY